MVVTPLIILSLVYVTKSNQNEQLHKLLLLYITKYQNEQKKTQQKMVTTLSDVIPMT